MNIYHKVVAMRAITTTSHQPAFSQRDGITLMETIFAIGIILTGLVGLAALIPVAANNAKATLELDRSVSESTSAAANGLIRNFIEPNNMVIFDRPAAESYANTAGTYGYNPSGMLRTVRSKLDATPPGKLESPGYGHMPFNSGLSAGICIDPLGMPNLALDSAFVSDANGVMPPGSPIFIPAADTDTAFDASRFPYYGERYAVLASPNVAIGTANPASPPPNATPWPMSPRMWRATLRAPMFEDIPLVRRHHLLTSAAVRNIFSGSGGLAPIDGAENSDPRSVLASRTNIGGVYVDGAQDRSTAYSWFATLAPPFLGGKTFRQSIVVVNQRVPPVPRRLNDVLALQKNPYAVSEPSENPSSERLTWIDPLSPIGFNGGVGGEVELYGSQAISDEMVAGEWVMLSRQPHQSVTTGAPPSTVFVPTGPAVHRWFKVLRVSEPELHNNTSIGGAGSYRTWSRRVVLAGPDWAFHDEGTTNTTGVDDTYCTIVTGAVSVIESEVVIE